VESRRLWLVLGFLVIAGYALVFAQGGKTLKEGTRIESLKAELSDGSVFDITEHRGEVIVLTFWASWCGPCRREAPVLSRLAAQGVKVIGLGVEEHSLERLAKDALELGARYTVGRPEAGVLERMRISVIPTTYVLDRSGTVVLGRTGLVPEDELAEAVRKASES
jgi:cytochrome c biogenesis protein CcmG, thiol:disulfide interchange protein DsbE